MTLERITWGELAGALTSHPFLKRDQEIKFMVGDTEVIPTDITFDTEFSFPERGQLLPFPEDYPMSVTVKLKEKL
jgi:hypothetical protein